MSSPLWLVLYCGIILSRILLHHGKDSHRIACVALMWTQIFAAWMLTPVHAQPVLDAKCVHTEVKAYSHECWHHSTHSHLFMQNAACGSMHAICPHKQQCLSHKLNISLIQSTHKSSWQTDNMSKALIPFDIIDIIMSFLAPWELFNLVFLSPFLMSRVTTEMVVKAALFSGGRANKNHLKNFTDWLSRELFIPQVPSGYFELHAPLSVRFVWNCCLSVQQ